jgi:hypothetical protein
MDYFGLESAPSGSRGECSPPVFRSPVHDFLRFFFFFLDLLQTIQPPFIMHFSTVLAFLLPLSALAVPLVQWADRASQSLFGDILDDIDGINRSLTLALNVAEPLDRSLSDDINKTSTTIAGRGLSAATQNLGDNVPAYVDTSDAHL